MCWVAGICRRLEATIAQLFPAQLQEREREITAQAAEQPADFAQQPDERHSPPAESVVQSADFLAAAPPDAADAAEPRTPQTVADAARAALIAAAASTGRLPYGAAQCICLTICRS